MTRKTTSPSTAQSVLIAVTIMLGAMGLAAGIIYLLCSNQPEPEQPPTRVLENCVVENLIEEYHFRTRTYSAITSCGKWSLETKNQMEQLTINETYYLEVTEDKGYIIAAVPAE